MWCWPAKINSLLIYFQSQINRRRYWRKNLQRVGLFLAMLMMIVGNEKLLLATISGTGIMFVVYQWQELNWQKYFVEYIKILTGSQKKFILAVSSGGVISVTTYMTAVIWTDSENSWLAAGTILQGLISVITLGLLGWQVFQQKSPQNKSEFEQFLIDLSSTSSLKRLIAVRYFKQLIKNNRLNLAQAKDLEEYFLLMLKIESEPIIKQALQENLRLENPELYLTKINFSAHNQPLQIPVKTKVRL